MTLAMGLNNVFAEEASEPKYLWRECHTGSSRNLYDSQLEVDNVYENETIRMADYAGQVNYTYINPILRSTFKINFLAEYKNLDLNSIFKVQTRFEISNEFKHTLLIFIGIL